MLNRVIALVDCQSFYASVEKAAHPEYRNKPVVVAGDPARRSGIILAACPIAKQYGVTTAETLGEAYGKCPGLVAVRPRMQRYIDVSMHITRLYRGFSDLVEPYSIDEQFIDLTGSLSLYGGSVDNIARAIQDRVMDRTGVHVRLGLGPNKVLAKMACDNYAKKGQSGIYELRKEALADTLWQLSVNKMFMAGSRMTKHFERMGMYTIGDVARTPLDVLQRRMRLRMGKQSDINAELYWRIANGIDDSPVLPGTHAAAPKSIGHMMTLPRDYGRIEDIKVVILELTELVCRRARESGCIGQVVSVSCGGADHDMPTGFSRQLKMHDATNITNQVYHAATGLFIHHWDGLPVRRVGVSLGSLVSSDIRQLSLFDSDVPRMIELERVTDHIKQKYGDSSIIRAVSRTDAGQVLDRSAKIGGHYR